MTWPQAFLAYAVSWWMILFLAAPIGAAKVTEATRKKTWLVKLLATTLIAGLVTGVISIVISSGLISVKS